jgi:hypothetical protein
MDPTTTAATTATNSTLGAGNVASSSGNLSSVATALQSTQSMMADALAQQQQMNQMKMEFDGQMAQLALQSAIEEKITTRLEQMAQSIAQ